MRLKSLTLQGFKSFADRTRFEFAPGITAVVGPNGSGKSNVIDALRWSTSGGRASAFRAGDQSELIFHGTSRRRGLGYAEVELELEHNARLLTVARTLTKDGQSNLKLAGKNARFLDLDEALAGTGLGRSGLSVIGQGEVSEVLMADPGTLLGYVSEVAGVSKLSVRREQTERRLESTHEHLTRLEDILNELREQCRDLEQETSQARRAGNLRREHLRLRYTLSLRRFESVAAEIDALREKEQRLAHTLQEGEVALKQAEAAWHTARRNLKESEARYQLAAREAEAKRGDARVAEERLKAVRQRAAGLAAQIEEANAEKTRLTALRPPTAPEGDQEALQHALEQAQDTADKASAAFEQTRLELQTLERDLEAARQRVSAYTQAKERYQLECQRLDTQLEHVQTRLHDLTDRAPDLERVEKERAAQGETLSELREQLTKDETILSALHQRHAQEEAEAHALARAEARAQAAFASRQGFTQGAKHALSANIPGVIGAVADLLQIPRRYRQALAAALGRRAENVVVERAEVAQRVIDHVRKRGGWVTALPLELIHARPPSLASGLANEDGVIGLCSEVITTEARFTPVVQQLLGSSVLVETMDQAVAIARRHPQRPRLITLAGDILESYGAMSGGKRQAGSGMLGLKEELERAAQDASAAKTKAERSLHALSAAQETVKARRASLAEGEATFEKTRQRVQQLREQLAARSSRVQELERQQRQLETERAALRPPPDTDLAPLDTLEASVAAKRGALSGAQAHDQQASSAVAVARQALAVWQAEKRRFDEAEAHFQQERERLGTLETQLETLHQEWQSVQQERERAEQAVQKAKLEANSDLSRLEQHYQHASAQDQVCERALKTLSEQQAEQGAELEQVRLSLARRETALELAQEDLASFPAGIESIEGGLKALRERASEVGQALEQLGPINHRAEQELESKQQRLHELDAQAAEAGQAAQQLASLLEDIDRSVNDRLERAAQRVKDHFRGYVKQLFGESAEADIEILSEAHRPVGLKMRLQPPGKQTRSLNLLSVGERTMGALAFLFSLVDQEGESGLPIAILDEVDAPLDEANIRRFCAFLNQLSGTGTQFVLITHQKATMEVAEVLWGVTSEGGVSRVFSIARQEQLAS